MSHRPTETVVASFPLSRGRFGNWAHLQFTRTMTEAEWDLFTTVLAAMKDGIVQQRDEETEPAVEQRLQLLDRADELRTIQTKGATA